MLPMTDGATDEMIDHAEAELGTSFPADYRQMLGQQNGSARWWGETFLVLYDVESLIRANLEVERHPGLLVIGSDGSREMIGFDLRQPSPPIVMIDVTSEGWAEAPHQAASLAEFMDQRDRGEPLQWDRPYESA